MLNIYFFLAISTTFEVEESSRVTNTVPHSSPLDVLQTTMMTPNDTNEQFCLVMGNVLFNHKNECNDFN